MVDFSYIIREDNTGKTISEDSMLDAVDIEETLKSRYIYLYNSIKETNYELKINHCTYFKEIVYKKMVVGFLAYTIINSVSNLSLVACYILPEYRAKGLFFDEINSVFEEGNHISMYLPPYFVIELLLKYGFAKKIGENIIVTSINIDVPSNMINKIVGSDKLVYEDYVYTSNIYDFNIDGFVVFPDESRNIAYVAQLKSETEGKVDVFDEKYLEQLHQELKDNKNIIENFLKNIEHNYSFISENIFTDEKIIDFEEIKKNTKKEEFNGNIVENFEKNENKKNSLYDSKSIDKEKYLKTYQDVAIYDFIKIFNDNGNLDLTNSIIKIDYELKNNYIKNVVLNEGYISNESDADEKENYLNNLKVNDLKIILKENNLTLTGNKSDLIDRIINYVPSENIIDNDYEITKKGWNFIDEHDDIEFYNIFLKNFYYYEFKEYLLKHHGDIADVAKMFLMDILSNSVEKKDNKAYNDSVSALAFINELHDNVEEGLYYELKKFIIGLNPLFVDEKDYNYYQPINDNNIENIKLLLFKGKMNLKEEFTNAWNSMEITDFKIPLQKSYKYLNQMISGKDRDYMNDKIRENYITKTNAIHDKLDKSIQSTLDKYIDY